MTNERTAKMWIVVLTVLTVGLVVVFFRKPMGERADTTGNRSAAPQSIVLRRSAGEGLDRTSAGAIPDARSIFDPPAQTDAASPVVSTAPPTRQRAAANVVLNPGVLRRNPPGQRTPSSGGRTTLAGRGETERLPARDLRLPELRAFDEVDAVPVDRRPRYHRVVDGDSLAALAERYLGTRERAQELYEANRDVLRDPQILPLGTTLFIPNDLATIPQPSTASPHQGAFVPETSATPIPDAQRVPGPASSPMSAPWRAPPTIDSPIPWSPIPRAPQDADARQTSRP